MGRTANLDFYGWDYEFSVEGAGPMSGLLPADAELQGWFPYFPYYREDLQGRLLFFSQLCGGVKFLRNDIAWMRAHPRPHFGEVFDHVDLREEWPAGQFKTIQPLHHVTLLEALEGLVEVLRARDAAARA